MAEAVGLAIVEAVALTGEAEGLVAFAEASYVGISGATAIGTAALLGASIGLNYALRGNPTVPKPEDGSQAIKQAIPPRLMGYWDNRLAGYYMLFEAYGDTSYDVIAFHHGVVEQILQVYLHDDAVATVPDPTHGSFVTVQGTGDGWYGAGRVQMGFNLGHASQTALGSMSVVGWDTNYYGNGVAHCSLICGAPGDPSQFTTIFPHGKPEPSVVARCTPVWDPRTAQDEHDSSTWAASPNPVLQLLDYLTRTDGGMGLDRETILPDEVLDQWMIEANLCDAINPATGGTRYKSAGWFLFDNNPEEIVNKILASCDGWMAEAGDGTLSLTVGVYREPTDDPIGDRHIFGFTINHGMADEQTVNQLDITFTDPGEKYIQQHTYPVRDEASIAASQVRSQPLDLTWVQYAAQAGYLGERALLRLNPDKTGTIVTSLYGMRYLGKRWVKLQYSAVAGLEDVVIEIQPGTSINILASRITFNFNTVNTDALVALEIPYDSLDFSKPRNSQYLALLEDI